jgi:hypothetical protein
MNSVVRGCKGPLRTTAAPAGSDGSPFVDGFSSTTVGYIAVFAALNTLANTNYVVNVGTDSALFDGAGNFTPNVSGSQVTWTTPYFIRGHSSVGGSIGVNGTTYTSASHTITYDVDTGTGFSGTWKSAATVTSIPNPATGCRIKFRWLVTGANSDAIQNFYLATVTDATTQQATYTLNAIALGVAGAVAGSVAAVYNPDASLAGTMTLAAGTETVTVFNDTTNPITGSLRLRSYGYTELTSSWSATDGPYAVPVVQYADPVAQLTAAAAGALSGLSVNWSSSTVTLTGPRSIREVYDWCKVQIAANPTKPNFISSTDGVNFTSTFNLVISGGALTGSGALNLGSNSLTISGGGSVSASLPITYAGGTRTALSFSVADIGGTALTGYEWRLYVASATAGAIGGPAVGTSEIAGAETQGTASVVVPLTISIPIAAELQIIQPGYQEYLVALTLTPAPTSLNIVLQTETNT